MGLTQTFLFPQESWKHICVDCEERDMQIRGGEGCVNPRGKGYVDMGEGYVGSGREESMDSWGEGCVILLVFYLFGGHT